MSAQPPPYAPESSFPQVKESYQEVQTQPASAKKLAASSNYTPAPPQLHSENNVSAQSLLVITQISISVVGKFNTVNDVPKTAAWAHNMYTSVSVTQ